MEDQKQYCEKLYQEYVELEAKMTYAFEWKTYRPGGKIESRPLPPEEDMNRLTVVKKELKEKCKPFLNISQSEWFKINPVRRK
jgi:hypothetical protein